MLLHKRIMSLVFCFGARMVNKYKMLGVKMLLLNNMFVFAALPIQLFHKHVKLFEDCILGFDTSIFQGSESPIDLPLGVESLDSNSLNLGFSTGLCFRLQGVGCRRSNKLNPRQQDISRLTPNLPERVVA